MAIHDNNNGLSSRLNTFMCYNTFEDVENPGQPEWGV